MTVPDGLATGLSASLHDVRSAVAATRAALHLVQARPSTTPEERRVLQDRALTGALGGDMQTIARHVEAGETSWPEVFEGLSPDTDLLRGHLEQMLAQHRDAVVRLVAADPGFDPGASHEGV